MTIFSADKWGPIVQWKVNKLEINKNLKGSRNHNKSKEKSRKLAS